VQHASALAVHDDLGIRFGLDVALVAHFDGTGFFGDLH